MRQHVNPLSKHFLDFEPIPPLNEIFENPKLPIHIDIGCASGDFLFELAEVNHNWNYIGIEIREKLVTNANLKLQSIKNKNLYFSFGNANNIFNNPKQESLMNFVNSISFYFPDPWFKKKHHKRRVIQPDLINVFSKNMKEGALIFIKTDVEDLFNYIDLTISANMNFKKLIKTEIQFFENFNPNKIQTNREKYSIISQLNIYEGIYIKI